MKIGIDISPLSSGHKVRGVGAYVSLIKDNIAKFDKSNKYIFFNDKIPTDIDIVHYPYFDPYFPVLPFKNKVPTIVTVHDLTPIKFKNYFPSGIRGDIKWTYNRFLLKKADLIIVDSESSKKDVIEILGVSKHKIKVVYLAPNPIYKKISLSEKEKIAIRRKYNLSDRFMIYVGDVTWNKNLPNLIKAVKNTGINLYLIGKALSEKNFDKSNPWNKDRIIVNEEIKESTNISALGFLPDEDLLKIYNLADALIMPSFYEGFGLPVVEAMNCGCPVITTKEGSLSEVGGNAVYYVKPDSIESISEAIIRLNNDNDLRNKLSKQGLTQSKKFSIEKMMRDISECYQI